MKITLDDVKKYVAEIIGTMVLVTFGCGVAIFTGCDPVATSLAFGLVIVAMAYSIGNVSGCHVNPAVSLAMLISKKMSVKDFIFYFISQLIGATLGCLILMLVFGANCGYGANLVQQGVIDIAGSVTMEHLIGVVAEVILTFTFVLAILGVTSKTTNSAVAGIVIGLTLTLVHLLGLGITGTSVNPARSLIPALFAGGENLRQVWIYLVGPFAGSALAALVYTYFLDKKPNEIKSEQLS